MVRLGLHFTSFEESLPSGSTRSQRVSAMEALAAQTPQKAADPNAEFASVRRIRSRVPPQHSPKIIDNVNPKLPPCSRFVRECPLDLDSQDTKAEQEIAGLASVGAIEGSPDVTTPTTAQVPLELCLVPQVLS
eukprot:GEMP01109209.1.p1 GENE.GEMP01109209.1~~GEMP01109209.1.p1  ORF type:complete len:133 (+),score=16.50 GEMP01109209.1:131-529(+)